ncbi:MAG TPA: flagellar hook assembly protein FlgD [Burkholderiales bacterium]|nr:flagellar hook assembly protein FlgD [Burkholderiales bacterium]
MSQVQALTSGAAVSPSSGVAPTSADELQQRFLTLLVTQMQNQDPLNPLDNSQVTTQLAQLSTVSGIGQLNTTMQSLAASFSATQTLQAAGLIGRSVMVAGTQLDLSSGQGVFGVQLAQPVDSLKVTIFDSAGNVVDVADAGPQQAGIVALHWDGTTASGGTAADGRYRFAVSAVSGGKPVAAAGAVTLSVKQVSSVSAGASGAQLNLGDGSSASLSDIKQII